MHEIVSLLLHRLDFDVENSSETTEIKDTLLLALEVASGDLGLAAYCVCNTLPVLISIFDELNDFHLCLEQSFILKFCDGGGFSHLKHYLERTTTSPRPDQLATILKLVEKAIGPNYKKCHTDNITFYESVVGIDKSATFHWTLNKCY